MADNDTAVEKKRGRPKKSEGAAEKRPAKEDASADAPKAKRGRGRPKGGSKKGKKDCHQGGRRLQEGHWTRKASEG
uniref:Uncharacterized protein n=1 Tax=Amblyomma aureolatum TaxID=187763 RepID=A0A1E1WX69_9ACAR